MASKTNSQDYSLDGVREDAEDILKGNESRDDVVSTAKAYYSGSAVKIDGTESDVIDCFLGAWMAKKI